MTKKVTINDRKVKVYLCIAVQCLIVT